VKNDFFGFRVGNRKRTDARGVAGSLEAPDLFGAAMISENYALEQFVAELIVGLRRGGVWRGTGEVTSALRPECVAPRSRRHRS
jgi:hypothetical protein